MITCTYFHCNEANIIRLYFILYFICENEKSYSLNLIANIYKQITFIYALYLLVSKCAEINIKI